MHVRVIRFGDYRRMRWKNDRGETAEIAISPAAATVEQFDWRISVARIEASGPFSPFPGVDRTLCIVSGNGIELAVAGREPIRLGPGSPPLSFDGNCAAHATLQHGSVTDLNVMTLRTRFRHAVRRLNESGTIALAAGAATAVLSCGRGGRTTLDGAASDLGLMDCALAEPGAATLKVGAVGEGGLLLVEIFSA